MHRRSGFGASKIIVCAESKTRARCYASEARFMRSIGPDGSNIQPWLSADLVSCEQILALLPQLRMGDILTTSGDHFRSGNWHGLFPWPGP